MHAPRAASSGLSIEEATPCLYYFENKWPGAEDSLSRDDVSTDSTAHSAASSQGPGLVIMAPCLPEGSEILPWAGKVCAFVLRERVARVPISPYFPSLHWDQVTRVSYLE